MQDGKISRFDQVQSDISRQLRASNLPAFTPKPSKNPLLTTELRHAYTKYIHDINARCIHTNVADHFAEEVLAVGRLLDHEQARAFFVNVIQPATAGLTYVVEEMVVDAEKQQLAVKLSIQGFPENESVRERFGGGEVKLTEIALYGFTDGKISILVARRPAGFYPSLRLCKIFGGILWPEYKGYCGLTNSLLFGWQLCSEIWLLFNIKYYNLLEVNYILLGTEFPCQTTLTSA